MSDPVTRWLETFMCHRYAPLLSANGYDTLQSICQLHITKLVAMGIPLQHCHSIIENVSILRQTLSAEKLSQFDMNGRGMMNSCTQVPGGGSNGLYANGMAPYMYDPSGMDQSQMSMPFAQYGGMMGGGGLASVDGAGYGHMFGGMGQQQQLQGMPPSSYGSPFPVPSGDQMTMMNYQNSASGHYINGGSSYAHFPHQLGPTVRPVLQQQQQQQQQNPQEIADSIYHMASSAYRAPAAAPLPPSARSAATGSHPVPQQPPHQHTHMSTTAMAPLCSGGGSNVPGSGPMTGSSYSPGPPYGRPTGMLSPVMGVASSRPAASSSSSSHPSPTTATAGPMSPRSIRSPSAHGGGSHGQLSPGSVHSTSSPGRTPPPHILSQSHLHRSSPGASQLMLHPHLGGASSSPSTAAAGGGIYGPGIARTQHLTAAGMARLQHPLQQQQMSSPAQMMGSGSHPGGDSAVVATAAAAAGGGGVFGSPLQSLERLAQISDKYPVDPKSIVSGGAAGLHDAMTLYNHHHQHHQQQLLHQQQQLQQQLLQQQQQQLQPQSHLYAMYAGHSTGSVPYPASGYPASYAPHGDHLKQEAPDRLQQLPSRAGLSQSKKTGSKAAAAVLAASSSPTGTKTKAPGSKKAATVEKARKMASPMSPATGDGSGGGGGGGVSRKGGGAGSRSGGSFAAAAAAGGSHDASQLLLQLPPPPLQGSVLPAAAAAASASVPASNSSSGSLLVLPAAPWVAVAGAPSAAAGGGQAARGEHTLQALLSAPLGQLPPAVQLPDRSRPADAGGRVGSVVMASAAASPRGAAATGSGPVPGTTSGGGGSAGLAGAAGAGVMSTARVADGPIASSPEDLQAAAAAAAAAEPEKSSSPLASSLHSPVLDVATVCIGSSSSSSSADSAGSGFREDRCCAAGAETEDGMPSLDACKAGSPLGVEDGTEMAAHRKLIGTACADRLLVSVAAPADAVEKCGASDLTQRQRRWTNGEQSHEMERSHALDGYGLCSPAQPREQRRQQQQQQLQDWPPQQHRLLRQPVKSADDSVDDNSGSQNVREPHDNSSAEPTVATADADASCTAAEERSSACTVADAAVAVTEAAAAAAVEPAPEARAAPSAVPAAAGSAAQPDEQAAAQRPEIHPAPAGIDYSNSKNVPLRKRKQGLAMDAAAEATAPSTWAQPPLQSPAPAQPLLHTSKKQKTHARKLPPTPLHRAPTDDERAAAVAMPSSPAAAEASARGSQAPRDLAKAVVAGVEPACLDAERVPPHGHGSRRWPSSSVALPGARSGVPAAIAEEGGGRCAEGSAPSASAPRPVALPAGRALSLLLPSSLDRRAPQAAPGAASSEAFRHRPAAVADPSQPASASGAADAGAAEASAAAAAAAAPSRAAISPPPLGSTLRALMAASPPAKQVPSSCKREQPEAGTDAFPVEPRSGSTSVLASATIVLARGPAQTESVKRKRGRPLGSKNKKKDGLSYKPTKKDKSKQGASAKRSASVTADFACHGSAGTVGSRGVACPSPPLSVLSAQLKSAAAAAASILPGTSKLVVAAPKIDVPLTPEAYVLSVAASAGKAGGGDKQEARVASFTKVGRVKEMSPRHSAAVAAVAAAAAAPFGATARSLAADDSPWLCVFCHEVSNCRSMGDLFGPYRYVGSPCSPLASTGATSFSAMVQPNVQQQQQWLPPDTPESGKRGKPAVRTSPAVASARSGSGSHGGLVASGEPRPAEGNGSRPRTVWYHEDCVVWAPGVNLIGQQLMGLDEAIGLGEQSFCTRCARSGALLGCYCKGCSSKYHYLCAIDDGCTLTEENFSTICPRHNRGLAATVVVAEVSSSSSTDAFGQKGAADGDHQSSDSETPRKKPRY